MLLASLAAKIPFSPSPDEVINFYFFGNNPW
jgi:hypothetical protein